jgi:apolipoprotein N-acyltransferase
LPRPAAITPYGRVGDLIFWLMVLAGLASAAPALLSPRRS